MSAAALDLLELREQFDDDMRRLKAQARRATLKAAEAMSASHRRSLLRRFLLALRCHVRERHVLRDVRRSSLGGGVAAASKRGSDEHPLDRRLEHARLLERATDLCRQTCRRTPIFVLRRTYAAWRLAVSDARVKRERVQWRQMVQQFSGGAAASPAVDPGASASLEGNLSNLSIGAAVDTASSAAAPWWEHLFGPLLKHIDLGDSCRKCAPRLKDPMSPYSTLSHDHDDTVFRV